MSSSTTIGREPLTIVEIDQDLCENVYGVAPCTAAVGVTGDEKCFNCLSSCQDEDNYALGDPLTLRFSTSMENTGLRGVATLIPSLISVSSVSTRINIGGSDPEASPLGQRAQITATFRDHPSDDRLTDPYVTERDYDPLERGTFWSKWLARNPYHQGRAIRVRQGYVGQPLAEMRVRHFVIERIDGPTRGVVKILAVDPLKLLNDVRVQIPSPNTGVLDADIAEVDGSLTLSPAGIGNSEYPASGVGRIGSELVTYTRAADVVTLTARGLRGTVATTHAAGDIFQEVLVITSQRVDVLLADLMTNYASIDPTFIPTAEWDAEADLWCSGFDLSAWITEPTGVQSIIAEVLDTTKCFIWWDDEDQEIKFRATRPFFPLADDAAIEIDQYANIIADSFAIEPKPQERITQVWLYWAQINPTGAIDDPANYARRRVLRDSDAESAERYGDSRIKKIFCRFFDEGNDAATSVVGTRVLERQRETPILVKFATDAKELVNNLRAGKVIRLTHRDLVDVAGEALPTIIQLTSSEEVDPGHRIEFEGRPYLSRTHYAFIMENSANDYDTATALEKETGGYIAVNALGFDNGDPPYRIL